jgi:hypothetical protein
MSKPDLEDVTNAFFGAIFVLVIVALVVVVPVVWLINGVWQPFVIFGGLATLWGVIWLVHWRQAVRVDRAIRREVLDTESKP